jgi:hypothetical protein
VGIVVGVGVTQSGADYEQLEGAIEKVDANLGRKPEKMIVDEGYVSRENIIKASEAGVELIGSINDGAAQVEGQMRRQGIEEDYKPEAFQYDEVRDCFVCPEGKELKLEGRERRPGVVKWLYRARGEDCRSCPRRELCCPKAKRKGRSIFRQEEDERVRDFRRRMEKPEMKALYRTRAQLSEFTNAWIKEKMRFRQFSLRGLVKVTMEAIWVAMAYNFCRWIGQSRQPALLSS